MNAATSRNLSRSSLGRFQTYLSTPTTARGNRSPTFPPSPIAMLRRSTGKDEPLRNAPVPYWSTTFGPATPGKRN